MKQLGRAFLVEEVVCKKAGAERARGSTGQNKAGHQTQESEFWALA